MARRPEVLKHMLSKQELEDLNRRLAAMSVTTVREFYKTAYLGCRMDADRLPSARNVQELVQAWKHMHSWSRGKMIVALESLQG